MVLVSDLEFAVRIEAIDDVLDRRNELRIQWVEADIDCNSHRLESPFKCDAKLAWITLARVQCVREVRRLIAEVKATHRIVFIQQVARPQLQHQLSAS